MTSDTEIRAVGLKTMAGRPPVPTRVPRSGNVPPGQRSGYVGRKGGGETRQLPATGQRGRNEGGGLSSHTADPAVVWVSLLRSVSLIERSQLAHSLRDLRLDGCSRL